MGPGPPLTLLVLQLMAAPLPIAEVPHTYHPITTIQCHPTMRQRPPSIIIILRPLRVISLLLLRITPLPLSWPPQPLEGYSTLPHPPHYMPRKRPRCVWSMSWQDSTRCSTNTG